MRGSKSSAIHCWSGDFEADDYDKVGPDDDDGVYHPETGALEQTMARSEGGRDNEVMLISVQTFNFVI